MALSFAAGTLTLVNWGFSAGDIATLAGAGRAVGTWLNAQLADRALLDFMAIDIDSIITRKGFIDTVALHQRWDRKLRLLQNNEPVEIEHPGGREYTVVESLDRFTWIMILVVGALDAAVCSRGLTKIVSAFLCKLFKESPIGMEYLQRELNRHIQGWRSSACVRGVLLKARSVWEVLGEEGQHWPGQMPEMEERELQNLLHWLVAGSDCTFLTASTDVYCFAVVLQELGMEVNVASDMRDGMGNRLEVCFDNSFGTSSKERAQQKRWGMRVPLEFMEECVSLWPGDRGTNNTLRKLFEDGMLAVEQDSVKLCGSALSQTYDVQTKYPRAARRRLDRLEYGASAVFLPAHTYSAAKVLGKVLYNWSEADQHGFDRFLQDQTTSDSICKLEILISKTALAQLQVFLMGFYYMLLLPLIDTSYLSEAEAFGSWGYHDVECLNWIHKALEVAPSGRGDGVVHTLIAKRQVVALAGYLFAGVELEALKQLGPTTVGVMGKISLLTYACIGKIASPDDASKFCLLDVDTSCIPSNSRGVVAEGHASSIRITPLDDELRGMPELQDVALADGDEDFTSRIEPDWENDMQTVVVVFRHRGRLVSRVPPSLIEKAPRLICVKGIPGLGTDLYEQLYRAPSRETKMTHLLTLGLGFYHDGRIYVPQDENVALLVPVKGLPKARACILAMHLRMQMLEDGGERFVSVSTPQELKAALDHNHRFIVGCEPGDGILGTGFQKTAAD